MTRLRYNGLNAALGGSLTNSATSITFAAALTHSNGTAVPTISSPDYIPLAILDTSGHLSEIVWLTAYTSGATTGTIARGKEGTSGVTHSSGDKVVAAVLAADVTATHYSDTLAATFNSSAMATWTTITGLTFSLTPTTSGVLMLSSRVRLNHGASNLYTRATISPAPVSGSQYIGYSQEGAPTGRHTLPFSGPWVLAAGTAYTVTVEVYVASGGAWSVDATTEDTTLAGVFFPA